MNRRNQRSIWSLAIACTLAAVALSGCESLKQFGLSVQRPTAHVGDVSLTALTFSDAELSTEVVIDNPNAIGITISGFTYSLKVADVELVSGDQRSGASIKAFGSSTVDLPAKVTFRNLMDSVSAIGDATQTDYTIDIALRIDVPILGEVSIPLHYEGTLPVVRLPAIRVSDLTLDSIGIAGAKLSLTMSVLNPNSFAFTLQSLDYSFAVQQRVWLDGGSTRPTVVPAAGAADVTVSFSLSFADFGRALRDLLMGDAAIVYALTTSATVDPDLALIPTVTMPFDLSGSIPLRRR